jgi:hypothetical protein
MFTPDQLKWRGHHNRKDHQLDIAAAYVEQLAMDHFTEKGEKWRDWIIAGRMPPTRHEDGDWGQLRFTAAYASTGNLDGRAACNNLHYPLEVLGDGDYFARLREIIEMLVSLKGVEYHWFHEPVMCRCGFHAVHNAYRPVFEGGRVVGPFGASCVFTKLHLGYVWAKVVMLALEATDPETGVTWGDIFNRRGVNEDFQNMMQNSIFKEWVELIQIFQDVGVIKADLLF